MVLSSTLRRKVQLSAQVGKLLLAERLCPFLLNLLYDLPGNPVHIPTTHRPSNQHGTAIGLARALKCHAPIARWRDAASAGG